jgi:hypothetical protein
MLKSSLGCRKARTLEKGCRYGRVEAPNNVLDHVVRGGENLCESCSTFDELVTAEPAKGHTRSGVLGGSGRSKCVSASVQRSHRLASTASLSRSRPPDSTRRPSSLASRDDRGSGKAAPQKSAIPCQFCSFGRDCRYPAHRECECSSLERYRGNGKAQSVLEKKRTVRNTTPRRERGWHRDRMAHGEYGGPMHTNGWTARRI